MAKRRRGRKTVRLYTKDDLSDWIFVEYIDGRSQIEFLLSLNRHFIGASKRGLPWECLLVKGILLAAEQDPSLFPHVVKHAYVIGNAVYIVDRKPQRAHQLMHCIRYNHNFTKTLREFDTYSKRRFIRKFGDTGATIRLKPPRIHGTAGVSGTQHRTTGERTRVLRGAERRARDAGLIPPLAA